MFKNNIRLLNKSVNILKRYISSDLNIKSNDQLTINKLDVQSSYDTKLLKVAVIGSPNAGKSTLINSLVDSQICPTSKKVHTTRKATKAIFTEDNVQIVFVDTPGLVSMQEVRKYNLEKSFIRDRNRSLMEADIIGVIHDASNPYTREKFDKKTLELLQKFKNIPSFLVLNKIDLLKSKRKLLDLIRLLTENYLNGVNFSTKSKINNIEYNDNKWRYFSEIFMISALMHDGIDEIRSFLLKQSKPAPWIYKNYERTDVKPEILIVDTVKATLLDFLPQEIPYKLKTELEFFETAEDGTIKAVVLVSCPSERIEKLIVGCSEGKLKQINAVAQKQLQRAFYSNVSLRIVTISK